MIEEEIKLGGEEASLKDIPQINRCLEIATAQISGDFRKMARILEVRRDMCEKRGYHRVDDENKEILICYDCELWFTKELLEDAGLSYRIEPFL